MSAFKCIACGHHVSLSEDKPEDTHLCMSDSSGMNVQVSLKAEFSLSWDALVEQAIDLLGTSSLYAKLTYDQLAEVVRLVEESQRSTAEPKAKEPTCAAAVCSGCNHSIDEHHGSVGCESEDAYGVVCPCQRKSALVGPGHRERWAWLD